MSNPTPARRLAFIRPHCTVRNWDDLVTTYKHLRAEDKRGECQWIFRGEGSADYDLSPSLERLFDDFGYEGAEQRTLLEKQLVREFRRKRHVYDAAGAPEHGLELLALMRHHGAPTRLLDWTYSMYVAAFFALETARKDKPCAVWAINAWWCRKRLPAPYRPSPEELRTDHEDNIIVDRLLATPALLAYPVNPFRLNQRLTIQRGLFLLPGDTSKSFAENLVAQADGTTGTLAAHLKKIVIPWEARRDCLLELQRMNVTRATLFPGLDGFAESLRLSWWVLEPQESITDWPST